MSKAKTLVAITAWFMKVMLVIMGLVLLLYPGFAMYFRVIGLFGFAAGLLTFKRMQGYMLAEYGFRVPSAVTAVVLIVAIMTIAVTLPSSANLTVSETDATVSDGTLTFSMTVTNDADGPVIGTDVAFRVESGGETLNETVIESKTFGKGDTRMRVDVLQLSELSPSERTRIENGEYRIEVRFDEDELNATYTPS